MKPKQLFFTLLGILLAVIGGGIAAFIIMHTRLNSQVSDLQTLSAEVIIENEHLNQLQNLEEEYQEIAPLAEAVNNVLPKDKRQAEVVAQVSAIVKSVGLSLEGITFEATKGVPTTTTQTLKSPVSGVVVMPLHFQISANYQQLQSLLRQFESQERYMQVKTLEINRGDEGLIFTITLEAFLQP